MPNDDQNAGTTGVSAAAASAGGGAGAAPVTPAVDTVVERLKQIDQLFKGGKRIDAIRALAESDDLDDIVAEYVKEGEDPVKKKLRELDEAEARRVAADEKRKTDEEAERKTKVQQDSERYTASIIDKHKDKFKAVAKPENRAEVVSAAPLIAVAILKTKKIETDKATAEQFEEALCEAFDRIQKDWRKKYLEEQETPVSGGVGRPPPKASVKIASSGDMSKIENILARNNREAKYAGS